MQALAAREAAAPASVGITMKDDFSGQDTQLLLEIGYLAVDEGWHEHAESIFLALQRCDPGNPHPRIGQALVSHQQGYVDDSVRGLESVLADFPDAVFARSLLAHFLKLAHRPGWELLAQECLLRVRDGVAADLARTLLGPHEPIALADGDPSTLPWHARRL